MALYASSTSSPQERLCATFESLARETWREIARDLESSVRLGEEVITTLIIRELERGHRDQVLVVPHPKHMEGQESGADWEWWLIDDHEHFGMVVQAKKCDLTKSNFPSLHKKAASGIPQCKILIDYGKRKGLGTV